MNDRTGENDSENASRQGRYASIRSFVRQRARIDDISQLESSRYLLKRLMLSTLIGIVAGLGAIAFQWAIESATELFLGDIVGYMPPMPLGEGSPVRNTLGRPWLLPMVTTVGGLIAEFIVFRWAPEAEGHGTDAAVEAIHHK